MRLESTNAAIFDKDYVGGKTGIERDLNEFSTNSEDAMGLDREVKGKEEKIEEDNAENKKHDDKRMKEAEKKKKRKMGAQEKARSRAK
eukprot:15366132-Ditylum_brightwellii.AAC.1